ncbi:MAG: hypothetical protein EA400_03740, partial [Chromatiaceae bacterium]
MAARGGWAVNAVDLPPWPALADTPAPLPVLALRRGRWGKVAGGTSDYRWLACSPGFGAGRTDLAGALRLGAEDHPTRGLLWRRLPDRLLAVAVAPSHARDSAGRPSLLQKQVLEWPLASPPSGAAPAAGPPWRLPLPAALAALWLLPAIAIDDDGAGPADGNDPRWRDPAFALPAAPTALQPDLTITHARIVDGAAALTAQVPAPVLAAWYATLLAGGCPAVLPAPAALP